ncbi:MAG: hypothetical protein WA964_18780, partial [Ilumatobacter sp.]|uniref:hypothetical protein n=1 Tax=Ilumatobacter sp. TaxID=1967498 RepID=UPI003C7628EA
VVLGAGGVLAIDTKFRSDWNRAELKQMAASARRGASELERRMGQPRGTVQPMIVMWGPQIAPDSIIRRVDEVMFVPGRRLAEHIDGLAHLLDQKRCSESVNALDAYVNKRDIGEVNDHGEIPRPLPSYLNETFGLLAAVLIPMMTLGLLWPVAPAGLWSAVFLLGASLAAFVTRRRNPIGPIARIAIAAATTSTGLFVLTVSAVVAVTLST